MTLDRVLNVYPDWERLASLSAEHARRLYGVVIPRDTRFVRLVISAINLVQRLRRQRVRAAIVPIDELERILRQQGLSRRFSRRSGLPGRSCSIAAIEAKFRSGTANSALTARREAGGVTPGGRSAIPRHR